MRVPVMRGVIDRRILANYHIDPDVMARALPPPFRPKLVNGHAMGGICLIRFKNLRPRFSPFPWGLESENAAHRIAVEWDENGRVKEGVYVPRRDSNSWLSTLIGGSLFPGVQHRAVFTVEETESYFSVRLRSIDGDTRLDVAGTVADDLPDSSVFSSLAEASEFFERGSLGYSHTATEGRYDGLELRCSNWHVEPLAVERVESSYFGKVSQFPRGSVEFDCALLMRGIHHEWHSREDLCCAANSRGVP